MFGQVPVLPVVIPLGIAVFLLLLWRLRVRGLLSLPRAAVAAALSVYAAGVVGNTVFPIYLSMPAGAGPWTPPVAVIPFADYEFVDAATNAVVFLPVGVLLPLLLARPRWGRVMAVTVAVSLAIELAQFVTHDLFSGGHIADVNDVIWNVVGGATGYGLFRALSRVPALSALVPRFRWAPASDVPAPGRRS